ncbi:MAG: cation:proton antiporter [Candidatus Accumulibacter sp.]|jgi:Kef-type K+ transport system membrane component KefB|nr:cation:proton antiporter [Accumulibacter sp.]
MNESLLLPVRKAWMAMQDTLYFLPPFPSQIDTLALLSLLLVIGLLVAEWLRARWGWPRVLGYVIAGTVFGPPLLGWINADILGQLRPIADAAFGLLLLEAGRRLDLRWLLRNRNLLRGSVGDVVLSFLAIYGFACFVVGLSPAWAAATAAVTMASAPVVVLLIIEESRAQGQVTERVMMYSALGSAVSFIVLVIVLGFVHAPRNVAWMTALAHPLWAGAGAVLIGALASRLALLIAGLLPKRSLAQVFVLVAMALLAIGLARMFGVPVFLTLFLMGVVLSFSDQDKVLSYTSLPEGHWMLAIIVFVVVGALLPWREVTWLTAAQAFGLLLFRAAAKLAAMLLSGGTLPVGKRLLVGVGIQPLSATTMLMALEMGRFYPEIGVSALQLAFLSAAIMEIAGPVLCHLALNRANEAAAERKIPGGAS